MVLAMRRISSKLWMGKGNTVSLSIYQVYNEGEVETVLQENANLWQQQTLSHVEIDDETISIVETEACEKNPDGDEDVHEELKLFHCPEEGCTKAYQLHANLLKHIEIGKHEYQPEQLTLRAAAIRSYKEKSEQLHLTPCIPNLQEALKEVWEIAPKCTNIAQLPAGWALKTRRQTTIFNKKQRDYLIGKFNEGLQNKKKFDPKDVSKDMRKDALFEKSEYLTWQQIASFWSREASYR